MNWFDKSFKALNKNEMYLHKKRVEIAKLTPKNWRILFDTIDRLPGLVVQMVVQYSSANNEDFYAYVLNAIDLAMDEVVEVVSILTEIDKEYIENNVGLYEIFEYLKKTVELNRLDTIPKNVKSLLPNRNQM